MIGILWSHPDTRKPIQFINDLIGSEVGPRSSRESLSRKTVDDSQNPKRRFVNPLLKRQYGIDSMPETAENVVEDFSVSREDQDALALKSQQKAEAAMKSGLLAGKLNHVRHKTFFVSTPCGHLPLSGSVPSWLTDRHLRRGSVD